MNQSRSWAKESGSVPCRGTLSSAGAPPRAPPVAVIQAASSAGVGAANSCWRGTSTASRSRIAATAWIAISEWPPSWKKLSPAPTAPTPRTSRQMSASAAASGDAGPATPLAAALADIWREVLGVGAVGAGDSFFQLGGHSLMAIQAVAAIRDRLAVEVPLQQLFAAPTPAELAAWITATGGARGGAPALERVPRQGTLPLSFAQERLWFIDQLEPGSAAYVIAAAMRLTGGLDRRALRRALQRIVDRHEVLRACFPARLGLPALALAARLRLALPVVDLAALPAAGREAETRRLAAADALRPFDLGRPPLLRVT